MAVFYIGSYDIVDPNEFQKYPPIVPALGLYNDPAYQDAKRIRQASTKNVSMVLVEEFRSASPRK